MKANLLFKSSILNGIFLIYHLFFIIYTLKLGYYSINYSNATKLSGLESRIEKGKLALEETIKFKISAESKISRASNGSFNNEYNKELGCWKDVLQQFETLTMESCDVLGDATRSLMALSKTRCHFLNAKREFPDDEKDHCILNVNKLERCEIAQLLWDHDPYYRSYIEQYLHKYDFEKNSDEEDELYNEASGYLKDLDKTIAKSNLIQGLTTSINPEDIYSEGACFIDTENRLITHPCARSSKNLQSDGFCTSPIIENECENLLEPLVNNHNHYDYRLRMCNIIKSAMVNRCTSQDVMSDTAFQVYHNDLNHIDDICFYLHSSAWNRRTEMNIDWLSKSAMNAGRELEKISKLDGLFNVMNQDIKDIFGILYSIKNYLAIISETYMRFELILSYSSALIVTFFLTIPRAARPSRRSLFHLLILSLSLEVLIEKWAVHFKPLDPEWDTIKLQVYSKTKLIRILFALFGLFIWVRKILSYKSPIQDIQNKLDGLVKVLNKSSGTSKFKSWMDYFSKMNEDIESDSDYNNDLESNISSENSLFNHTFGQDTMEIVKEARTNQPTELSWLNLNDSKPKKIRRNPMRKARPKNFEAIPKFGQGNLIIQHPRDFVNEVQEVRKINKRLNKKQLFD